MNTKELPGSITKYVMENVKTKEYWEGLLMDSEQADDLISYGVIDPEVWEKKELIYILRFVEA